MTKNYVPVWSAREIENSKMQLVDNKYMLENDINVKDFKMHFCECPVTGHSDPLVFFFASSFSLSVSLSVSVDSCPDFLQFQGLFCGVESRWKTNRQRQF